MMMEWLLPGSLILISAGITLSVYEEWAEDGLTDTSITSLACWVVGLCGVAVWGLTDRHSLVFLVTILPAGLFSYWIFLKLRDEARVRRGRR